MFPVLINRRKAAAGLNTACVTPGEPRQVQNHVVMFGVCGLMSMMLTWHENGFTESPRDLGLVSARLLTQPLFPAAGKLL